MSEAYRDFMERTAGESFNTERIKTFASNISRYNQFVEEGKKQYKNLELAKERATFIKNNVINDLPKYLVQFENNFQSRGGKVIWAQDAEEAVNEIAQIIKKYNTPEITKDANLISDEIFLQQNIGAYKLKTLDYSLFMNEGKKETTTHTVNRAIEQSHAQIFDLIKEKLKLAPQTKPEQLIKELNNELKKRALASDICITGSNFLIADTGGVSVVENEGTSALAIAFSKVHIVLAGVETVIPKLTDLHLFFPLYSTYATGKKLSVFSSIYTGPQQSKENEGPKEMYVVLLDNGRSEILEQKNQRRALSCIQCGACSNACPVYKTIGGETYNTTYNGPIGAVVSPWLKGVNDYKHLTYASSICGACTLVCPVNINIHELILHNRNYIAKNKKKFLRRMERFMMFLLSFLMVKRTRLDWLKAKNKNKYLATYIFRSWKDKRSIPQFAEKSFNQLWQEKYGLKK